MLFVYGVERETNEYKLELLIPGMATVGTGEFRTESYRSFGRRRTRQVEIMEDVFTWTMKNENTGESYLQDVYDAGLAYTSESKIDISVGDRNAYINDGVNPIQKVTVTPNGELVASFAGLKAPKNKPRITLKSQGEDYHAKSSSIEYTTDVDGKNLGGMGLIQAQYTVVTETGDESNPSPMSDWANGQFFKIAEDGVSDVRLIKSLTVYDLNVPNIPENLRKKLKYFKIYYRIVRYSEGVELDSMEFSVQKEINEKTTATINTGNTYTLTNIKSVGQVISYENDAGMPCKTSAVNAGVVMVGGITKQANIPGNFQYMPPINIVNDNLSNYVDAVVQVQLSTKDMVDELGNVVMQNWSYYLNPDGGSSPTDIGTGIAGERGIKWKDKFFSKHLRIYDTDMTTPLMVYVPHTYVTAREEAEDGTNLVGILDVYVKIPLLAASARHTIYFCFNNPVSADKDANGEWYLRNGFEGIEDKYNDVSVHNLLSGAGEEHFKSDGVTEIDKEEHFNWENNIGIHYGRWCLSSDPTLGALSRQQVFQHRRVPSGSTEILTTPNTDDLGTGDIEKPNYDLANRANLSNNGEATSIDDPLIIQHCIAPPTSSPIEIVADQAYTFGGNWQPSEAWDTVLHTKRTITTTTGYTNTYNDRHQSASHYGAPTHNASRTLEDGTVEYYVNKDDDGEEVPLDHTHLASSSPGEWIGDTFEVQTYKLSIDEVKAQALNLTTTRGVAPISTLDSSGEDIENFYDINDVAWTSLPSGLDKLYMIPGVFQLKLPILQHQSYRVSGNYDNNGDKSLGFESGRKNYHSIGSFKPWCGGWSFRKQALSIGQMPDKGYIFTTITFRKKDIADSRSLESEKGIFHGGTRFENFKNYHGAGGIEQYGGHRTGESHLNTIFYISCGSINDPDAIPNNPVTFYDNFYDSVSELGESDVTEDADGEVSEYAGNKYIRRDALSRETGRTASRNVKWEPRTKGYNRDNFRPTSVSGMSPGELERKLVTEQEGGTGLPYWSNNGTGDTHTTWGGFEGVEDEKDPKLDQDPKRNLINLQLYRQVLTEDGIRLKAWIGSQNGYSLWDSNLYIKAIEDVEPDQYVSIFVYMSWDMIDEKIAVGWSLVDTETEGLPTGAYNKTGTMAGSNYRPGKHYSPMTLVEFDLTDSDVRSYQGIREDESFQDRFKDKQLYDIGLGTSSYMNRVISGLIYEEEQSQQFTQSGFHGFYGVTEMTIGDYITDKNQILSMRNGTPRYEVPVGVNWDDYTQNNNISFGTTKDRTDNKYDNMIMWSELGKDGFPDLNYKLLKEPVEDILSAPSFLKQEYTNTFLIFTRNTINRFVLKGTATGWAGSAESLIEEQLQFGLFAPKTLTKIGAELLWYSEEGVIRWNSEGMMNISKNVIDIPLSGDYIGFYVPLRNVYVLHDNSTYTSYVYHMTYRMWTTFTGLNIMSSSILSRGSASENMNLFLNSRDYKIYKYPGDDLTSNKAHIKTMDLFMDSGQIKRVKVDYNGNSSANLTYNLAYNDKDSNNIERSTTIRGLQKNTWRGLGDLGRLYGRVASFELENADEIFTIIYDAVSRGDD